MRKTTVYKGITKGEIVHIGITTQDPKVRFRTHEKRKLIESFEVIAEFEDVADALSLERELIEEYNPKYSKRLKQNDNRKLAAAQVKDRVGNKEWCQKCLKRRVNKGYKICFYCSKK